MAASAGGNAMLVEAPDSLPKRIGRYEVLKRLSVGGMAELFLCAVSGQGGFRKYVVVKRILQEYRKEEAFVRMFLDEARLTAAFSHRNLVQVFEMGEEDGVFLAMEFVSGKDLNEVAFAALQQQRVLPIGFSVSVACEVADALHYAHQFVDAAGLARPVIHRDVAQKNIMVTYDGLVKLLDFGVAKAEQSLFRTQTGMVKGTAGYMSPEQVRAEPLDGRSDVFCLGVVLHEMVTGKRLFSGASEIVEMRMILDAPIPKPISLVPELPEALSEVILRALAREKADRFASAKDFRQALEAAAGGILLEADDRAILMKELFSKQLKESQSLLSSSERLAAEPEPTDPEKEPSTNVDFRATQVQPAPEPARQPPAAQNMAATKPVATQGPESSKRLLWLLGAVALLLAGLAGLRVARDLQEESKQAQLMDYLAEKPIEPPPGAPEPAPQEALPPSPPAPLEDESEPAPLKPAPRRPGQLTLVTFPEAKVFRGKELLGTTPLFQVPLPAGTHTLVLKGQDGVRRKLSAPIKSGKTTTFRLKLRDVPAK